MNYFMINTGRSRTWEVILIIGLFTVICCGFIFYAWPLTFDFVVRSLSVILLFFFLYFLYWGGGLSKKQHFRYFVLALAFLPFGSVLYSHTEYGQPVLDGIKGTLPSLFWLFYFVLHRFKVKEGSFVKAMLCIAIFILAVQVIQQFTYPHVWFGIRNVESLAANQELTENRNGIWRFHIDFNAIFTAVCLFYFWCKMRRGMVLQYPVIIVLMLVSVYLSLSRQLMLSAVLTLILSFFLGRKKMIVWPLFIGGILLSVVYLYWDVLFGQLQQMTGRDLNKDYIRFAAAKYFWTETFSSVKSALLGHGSAISGSYLALTKSLQEENRFYPNDVGFIGVMWKYGVFYVLVCYGLLIYLFVRYRHHISLYVILFIIFMVIPSIMVFPMNSPIKTMLWCFLLYFCDVRINRLRRLRQLRLLLRKYKIVSKKRENDKY